MYQSLIEAKLTEHHYYLTQAKLAKRPAHRACWLNAAIKARRTIAYTKSLTELP